MSRKSTLKIPERFDEYPGNRDLSPFIAGMMEHFPADDQRKSKGK
jgi:hypothetical protein